MTHMYFFLKKNIDKVKLLATSEFITSSSSIISKTVYAKFNNNKKNNMNIIFMMTFFRAAWTPHVCVKTAD